MTMIKYFQLVENIKFKWRDEESDMDKRLFISVWEIWADLAKDASDFNNDAQILGNISNNSGTEVIDHPN